MASSNSQDVVDSEPPRKRQRLSPPPPPFTSSTTTQEAESKIAKMDDTIKQAVVSDTGFQPEREAQVGILHFVNSENIGFTGTLKQRYVLRVSCLIVCSFEMI
jgi:tRNA pseudouridine13 synthase